MANQKNNNGRRTNMRATTVGSKPSTQMANQGSRRQTIRQRGPQVSSTNQGLIVSNAEILIRSNSLIGSNAGGWFGLNPGDENVFPWLSLVARGYGYYRWKKLKIMYVSGCGSTVLGDVTFAPLYDYEDAVEWASAGSIIALTQAESAVQGPVWASTSKSVGGRMSADMMIDIDVTRAHMRTPWHIVDSATTGAALDNQAVAVYLARMFSPNGVGSVFCGSFWADYEIELRHPAPTTSNVLRLASLSGGYRNGEEIEYPAYPDGSRKPPPVPKPDPPSGDPKPVPTTGDSADVGSDREVQT